MSWRFQDISGQIFADQNYQRAYPWEEDQKSEKVLLQAEAAHVTLLW